MDFMDTGNSGYTSTRRVHYYHHQPNGDVTQRLSPLHTLFSPSYCYFLSLESTLPV
jgi:hypothetical protein